MALGSVIGSAVEVRLVNLDLHTWVYGALILRKKLIIYLNGAVNIR